MHKCITYFLAFYKYILCRKSNRNYSSTQSLHTFQHSSHFVEEKVLLHSSWQNSLQCCLATTIVLIEKNKTKKKDGINFHTDTFTFPIFIAFVRNLPVTTFGDRPLNYLLLTQHIAAKFLCKWCSIKFWKMADKSGLWSCKGKTVPRRISHKS